MKKRALCILLSAVMLVALAACGAQTPAATPAPAASAAPAAPAASVAPAASAAPSAPDAAGDQSDWVQLTFKEACYQPDSNPTIVYFTMLQERLEQYMPGKITIDMYNGGVLYGQADTYDGVLSGGCDIGFVDLGAVTNRFPLSQLFAYPGFGFNSSGVAGRVLMEWIETYKPAEYDDVIVLANLCSGPMSLTTTKKVEKLADVQGMQLRGTGFLSKTVESWGLAPVTLDTTEVYEALRSGLLDGNYGFYSASALTQLDEIGQLYNLISNLNNVAYIIVMNKDSFAKMPPSQQEVFMKAARECWEEWLLVEIEWYYRNDDRIVEYFGNTENTFLDPTSAEYKEFLEPGLAMRANYIAQLDTQGLDASGQLKNIEAITAKYNSELTWEDYMKFYPID